MTKDQVESLIALIIFKRKEQLKRSYSEKDLCIELELNEDYISQQRTRGRFTESFVSKMKSTFSDIIKNQEKVELKSGDLETVIYSMAARQKVHGHFLAEIFASEKGVSVAKVLIEMEQLEKETATLMLKAKS